mmetsp:Transcript_73307/g.137011  ORF Transcript_73307/g.137011 Transcript_73307/m.137011 type:complete len:232 (-) Transcript_73307:85-780(-)
MYRPPKRVLIGVQDNDALDERDAKGKTILIPTHYLQSQPVQQVLTFLAKVFPLMTLSEHVLLGSQEGRMIPSELDMLRASLGFVHSPLVQQHRTSDVRLPHNAMIASRLFSEGLQQQIYFGLHNYKVKNSLVSGASLVRMKGYNMAQHMATSRVGIDIIASEDTVVCSGKLPKNLIDMMTQDPNLKVDIEPIAVPLCCARRMEPCMYRSQLSMLTAPVCEDGSKDDARLER